VWPSCSGLDFDPQSVVLGSPHRIGCLGALQVPQAEAPRDRRHKTRRAVGRDAWLVGSSGNALLFGVPLWRTGSTLSVPLVLGAASNAAYAWTLPGRGRIPPRCLPSKVLPFNCGHILDWWLTCSNSANLSSQRTILPVPSRGIAV